MRVLVCGDREWRHKAAVWDELDDLIMQHQHLVLIEGGARGADRMAGEWAEAWLRSPAEGYSVEHLHFPADWKRYGKGAGPKRNQQMLDEGEPDLVIAFHANIAASRGTADMVRRALAADVPVRVVEKASG